MKRLILFGLTAIVLVACQKQEYVYHSGQVFGTFYHIQYQASRDYQIQIDSALKTVNKSLSTYDSNSVISKINRNIPCGLDAHFTKVFNKGQLIAAFTNGAFDMTVSPLVNAWGFGFKTMQFPDSVCIDSLMQYVGYQDIEMHKQAVFKRKPNIQLDASAIAKGYGVDVVAHLLEAYQVQNYLVEIGGEIRLKGKNKIGQNWTVGIDVPEESAMNLQHDLQDVISIGEGAIATSGNYRQYYYRDGQKYAHTIDPKTGYPVRHNILSATVIAKDCMTADALATAAMVMGVDKTKAFAMNADSLAFYLIYAKDSTTNEVWFSDAFEKYLSKKPVN